MGDVEGKMLENLLLALRPKLKTQKKAAITSFESYFFITFPNYSPQQLSALLEGDGVNCEYGLCQTVGIWKFRRPRRSATMALQLIVRLLSPSENPEHFEAVRRALRSVDVKALAAMKLEKHLAGKSDIDAAGRLARLLLYDRSDACLSVFSIDLGGFSDDLINTQRSDSSSENLSMRRPPRPSVISRPTASPGRGSGEDAGDIDKTSIAVDMLVIRSRLQKGLQARASAESPRLRRALDDTHRLSQKDKRKISQKLRRFFASRRDTQEALAKRGILKVPRMFGVSLVDISAKDLDANGIPKFVLTFCTFLQRHALNVEGIFRISGDQSEITRLKQRIDYGEEVHLTKFAKAAGVHVVSGLLKMWLRELREPLLPYALYDELIAAASRKDAARIVYLCRERLPRQNLAILDYLMNLLAAVCELAAHNKMSPTNVAIVFAPNLIKPEVETFQTIAKDAPHTVMVIKSLIEAHMTETPTTSIEDKENPARRSAVPQGAFRLPPTPPVGQHTAVTQPPPAPTTSKLPPPPVRSVLPPPPPAPAAATLSRPQRPPPAPTLPKPQRQTVEFSGQWKHPSGGYPLCVAWFAAPQYVLDLDIDESAEEIPGVMEVSVTLVDSRQSRPFQVGLMLLQLLDEEDIRRETALLPSIFEIDEDRHALLHATFLQDGANTDGASGSTAHGANRLVQTKVDTCHSVSLPLQQLIVNSSDPGRVRLILIPQTQLPEQFGSFRVEATLRGAAPRDAPLVRLPLQVPRIGHDLSCLAVEGEWRQHTNSTGGCFPNFDSWRDNPQFLLRVGPSAPEVGVRVYVHLERQDEENLEEFDVPISFYLMRSNLRHQPTPQKVCVEANDVVLCSEFSCYRSVDGLAVLEESPEWRDFVLLPTCFAPGQEGVFRAVIWSDAPIEIRTLHDEQRAACRVAHSSWQVQNAAVVAAAAQEQRWSDADVQAAVGSAGGCCNYATWRCNPKLLLEVTQPVQRPLVLSLSQSALYPDQEVDDMNPHAIGFYVLDRHGRDCGKARFSHTPEVMLRLDQTLVSTQAALEAHAPLVLVPACFHAGQEAALTFRVFGAPEERHKWQLTVSDA